MLNPDFRDILSEFTAAGVEFLVVGAYAMAVHSLPRATGDIDLWVRTGQENADRILEALARFGAPLDSVSPADFARPGLILQIGVVPRRIDILTQIDGVDFEDAWPDRLMSDVGGVEVPVISRAHLLQNKRASARPKDLADAQWLEST